MKRIFLILLVFVAASSFAQSDVFEYATVVSWIGAKPQMFISYSNGDYKEIDIDKNLTKPTLSFNQSAVLKQIAQMSGEGWEVINSQTGGTGGWSYFLKRKQKSK